MREVRALPCWLRQVSRQLAARPECTGRPGDLQAANAGSPLADMLGTRILTLFWRRQVPRQPAARPERAAGALLEQLAGRRGQHHRPHHRHVPLRAVRGHGPPHARHWRQHAMLRRRLPRAPPRRPLTRKPTGRSVEPCDQLRGPELGKRVDVSCSLRNYPMVGKQVYNVTTKCRPRLGGFEVGLISYKCKLHLCSLAWRSLRGSIICITLEVTARLFLTFTIQSLLPTCPPPANAGWYLSVKRASSPAVSQTLSERSALLRSAIVHQTPMRSSTCRTGRLSGWRTRCTAS